jgi:hypothetical protein
MGLFIAAALRLWRVGSGLGGFGAGRVHLIVCMPCNQALWTLFQKQYNIRYNIQYIIRYTVPSFSGLLF